MSLSLTPFSSGAAINATTMRGIVETVETYVNEQVAAADRGSGWMTSNHVYRPDFFGGVNPHTTATSGETYFRERSTDVALQSVWTYYLGDSVNSTGLFPIPGLCARIQIPENINEVSGGRHRVRVFASAYVYEYGGDDGGMAEDTNIAFHLNLAVDGSGEGERTPIYKGSSTGTAQNRVMLYPRHQVVIMKYLSLGRGVHDIAIAIDPRKNVSADATKLCFVVQGNLCVRYSCR